MVDKVVRPFPCGAAIGSLILTVVTVLSGCSSSGTSSSTTTSSNGSSSSTSAPPASTVDWKAVGLALGSHLDRNDDGVYSAEFPRDELHVTTQQVTVGPGMEIGAEFNFLPIGGPNALLIGEMTVTEAEQQQVIDRLQRGGVEITAIHKHLPAQTPPLSWIHVDSYGDAVATARALHDGLAATATPPPSSQPGNQELPAGLDTAMLDRVLGTHGSIEEGVYHARIPVTVPVTDSRANVRLPADMEAASLLMFQLLPDNKVAANGDLAVTAERLNPTLAALRNGGIQVLTTHNHMLNEQPRLFYTHYWATGDPASLARALRGALEQAR